MAAPPEVLYWCGAACRGEQLHRLQSVLSRGREVAALYKCTGGCSSPAREISDPESRTPTAKHLERAAEQNERARWASETDVPVRGRPRKAPAFAAAAAVGQPRIEPLPVPALAEFIMGPNKAVEKIKREWKQEQPARPAKEIQMPKTVPVTGGGNPLMEAIEKAVSEQLAEKAPQLVRDVLAEMLGTGGSDAPPVDRRPLMNYNKPICPRKAAGDLHKGRCGKKCREAGE